MQPTVTTRRVIGIDPGSIKAGWGVVEQNGRTLRLIASGTIRLGEGPLIGRLDRLDASLREILGSWKPTESAIEAIFHQRNADSALKLGHARGVAMLALHRAGLPVDEYAPALVRKSVLGHGGADKEQVRAMMRMLLNAPEITGLDESDAIAIAVCHLHHNTQLRATPR
jgi:crossover junction endodeoxyribonuclease RuvC